MLSLNNFYISLSLLIIASTMAISNVNKSYFITLFMLFFSLTIINCWAFLKNEKSIYYVFACIIFIIAPTSFGLWGTLSILKLLVIIYILIYLLWLVDFIYKKYSEERDFLKTVAHIALFLYMAYYLSSILLNSFILKNYSPPLISVYAPLSIAVLYIPSKILFFTICTLIVAWIDKDRTGVLICSIALIYFSLEKFKFAINKKLFLSLVLLFPYVYLITITVAGNLFDISEITSSRSEIAIHWWKIFTNHPELLISGFGDNDGYANIFTKNNSESSFTDYSQPHNIVLGEILRMGVLNVVLVHYFIFRIITKKSLHFFMVPTLLFLVATFSFGGPSNLIMFHPLNVIFFLFFFSMMKTGRLH